MKYIYNSNNVEKVQMLGHNQRFRVIHNVFKRYMETISRYFKQVLYALGEVRE
jgi:hypothetical protein